MKRLNTELRLPHRRLCLAHLARDAQLLFGQRGRFQEDVDLRAVADESHVSA